MVDVMVKLPTSLLYEVLNYYDNLQKLSWRFAIYRNPSKSLIIAAKNGNIGIVAKCVGLDLSIAVYSEALRWAAQNGHSECVKLLIPVSDPTAQNSWALRYATYYGHFECIKLLIPVSDPSDVEELELE